MKNARNCFALLYDAGIFIDVNCQLRQIRFEITRIFLHFLTVLFLFGLCVFFFRLTAC